jgi:sodium/proline symporter
VWLWAGAALGAALSLFYLAPRLRTFATGGGVTTVLQILSADAGDRLLPTIARSIAFIAVSMLLVQAGVALRAASTVVGGELGLDAATIACLGVAVVAACVLRGGVRAAAALEAVQVASMVVIALLMLAGAYAALGGAEQLELALGAADPRWIDPYAGKEGVVAVAFAGGGLGLGLLMTGQPHALARFMAARDDQALRSARWAALGAVVIVTGLALAVGGATHLLYAGLEHPEQALYATATRLAPPWLASVLIAGLVAALVSSIAGPVLSLATTFALDLRRSSAAEVSSGWLKAGASCAFILSLTVGLAAPLALLDHAWLAFNALGASLGPLLLVRLGGKRTRPGSMLGALWSAFTLSIIFHLLPDSPGDFMERVLPFVAALGIALSGGERRRPPDRAAPAGQTVHDRLPI